MFVCFTGSVFCWIFSLSFEFSTLLTFSVSAISSDSFTIFLVFSVSDSAFSLLSPHAAETVITIIPIKRSPAPIIQFFLFIFFNHPSPYLRLLFLYNLDAFLFPWEARDHSLCMLRLSLCPYHRHI